MGAVSADSTDLSVWLASARAKYPDSPEIEPGVTLAEAETALGHVMVVQGGWSTLEIEAKRLSRDRQGRKP